MRTEGLVILLFFIFTNGNSQEISNDELRTYSIRSSVFSMGGSSKTVILNNKTFNISHSIGQLGVIGTYRGNEFVLRQGYQQPPFSSLKNGTISSSILKLSFYPNPFTQFLNISFNERINSEVEVFVYDLVGKAILHKKYRASQFIYIPIRNLANGTYYMNITSNNKKFSTKLIKN